MKSLTKYLLLSLTLLPGALLINGLTDLGQKGPLTLNYVIVNPRAPITLDLFEAERYEPAIIVQSLVGNLVYYSNFGRYEPRIAKRWSQDSPSQWRFTLKKGFKCENGELITPESFSNSLKRILKIISAKYPPPVLNYLKGYRDFSSGKTKDLEGIKFDHENIYFEFDRPVRSGVLQVLSFAPFGYICKDNLLSTEDGWKDPTQFISSGPYKVENLEMGSRYELVRNEHWSADYLDSSPEKIVFIHDTKKIEPGTPVLVDPGVQVIPRPEGLKPVELVPEYLNAIVLGNLETGPFADIRLRHLLKQSVLRNKHLMPNLRGHAAASDTFYPNQQTAPSPLIKEGSPYNTENTPQILIEGTEPEAKTPSGLSWSVLKVALDEIGLRYQFNNNETTFKFVGDDSFDIRMIRTSIGGGVEPWGIGLLFCSSLGLNLPDPTNKICELVGRYEAGHTDLDQFKQSFFAQVESDSSIFPMSHHGVQLFISDTIDQGSFSPSINILRFDQLRI